MTKRKLGKRSVEESYRTKEKILLSAIHLFCEKGYEVTSLRKVSQASMVSHSCISHHFGTKEKLWLDIGEYIYVYMDEEMKILEAYLKNEKCSNKKIYLLSVYVIALLLRHPIPIKYMSETMRISNNIGNHFRDEATSVVSPILNRIDAMSSHLGESMHNLKWILISGCYSGVSLTLLSRKSRKFKENMEVQHWRLYNRFIADYCGLDDSDQMSIDEIDDLILYLYHPLRAINFSTTC